MLQTILITLLSSLLVFANPQAFDSAELTLDYVRNAHLNNTECLKSKMTDVTCFHVANTVLEQDEQNKFKLLVAAKGLLAEQAEKSNEVVETIGKLTLIAVDMSELEDQETKAKLVYNLRRASLNDYFAKADLTTDYDSLFVRLLGDVDPENQFKNYSLALRAQNAIIQATFGDHSALLSTKQFTQMMEVSSEPIKVFGFKFSQNENGLQITRAFPGSPAKKAGIKPLDVIVGIDDMDVKSKSFTEWSEYFVNIQKVKFEIERFGEAVTIELERGEVLEVLTEWRIFKQGNRRIGHLKFFQFKQGSAEAIKRDLELFKEAQVDLVILDLRNNGGGLLNESVAIVDLFIGKNKIVSEIQDIYSNEKQILKTSRNTFYKGELIVLQNARSASASEIVAGALRDHKRAIIVGDKSFGKGSVQSFLQVFPFKDHTMKVNIARFHQPNGMSNQLIGIDPHFSVESKSKEVVLREADMMLFPVQASGKAIIPKVSRSLKRCVENNQTSENSYGDTSKPGFYDYQLLESLDIASCILK